MKKSLKIIFIIVIVILSIIVFDTIQARIFKKSPMISWRESLSNSSSWVDRGFLIDTYYCKKEQNIITVSWRFKTSKFTCPIYNMPKLNDYDFSVIVHSNSQHKKELAFTYNEKKYYYGNTKFELFLKSKSENNKYDLETATMNNMISFSDILAKADKVDAFWDGGSKIYYYNNFNIIVCNTLAGNKDIIIGDTEITADEFCK